MTKRIYKLSPVDSWFFRDGRPYNKGESNQTDVKSIFPPFAPTVVGALRVAFARNMRWNGSGDWSYDIKKKLGDRQKLDPLKFKGPYLAKEEIRKDNDGGKIETETLFPAPLHLLGKKPLDKNDTWTFTRLRPGKEVICDIGKDMGKVRLPEPENRTGDGSENGEKRGKPLTKHYLTQSDLEKVLCGGSLNGIKPVNHNDLWELEFNVGIERDEETLTTGKEGALFSRQFIRPAKGVSILVEVEGIDEGMKPQTAVTFGGESKMAYVEEMDSHVTILPGMPELKPDSAGKVKFTVTFLTPADISPGNLGSGRDIPELPGVKLVSACIGKPVRIGGWDSISRGPLPLKPFIPAGSTFFCEADNLESVPENGSHIGDRTEYGYGQIAIGKWNDSRNKED